MSITPQTTQQVGEAHTGQWRPDMYAGLGDYLLLISLGLLIGVIILIVRAWTKDDNPG